MHSIYAHFVVLLRELNDWPLCVLAFIAVALAVFETGIVSETKYNKTRRMETKTSVFATSNSVEKIIPPLKSRFFVVKLQAYTYEQFYQITVRLLTSNHYNVDEEIAEATADAVWYTSRNIRDSIKIARMAKSIEDVDWLVTAFLKQESP